MSAYVVDPRTIDYLVQWAHRHTPDHTNPRTRVVWQRLADVPEEYQHAVGGSEDYGYRLNLIQLSRDQLGRILMAENVRGVRYRYSGDGRANYYGPGGIVGGEEDAPDPVAPDDLPGPVDQSRVWNYRFRRIHDELRPSWVVKCCDCLEYQSCEAPDWPDTLAHAIKEAIRESAIDALTEAAPWGLSDADLPSTVAVETR